MPSLSRRRFLAASAAGLLPSAIRAADPAPPLLSPPYRWTLTPPLVSPADRPADPCHAVKDPSVVFHAASSNSAFPQPADSPLASRSTWYFQVRMGGLVSTSNLAAMRAASS